jgi:hypothetical protein
MARYTDRWDLSVLGPGDTLAGEGYKAVDADRRLIDRLLTYAVEEHHHSGVAGVDRTPVAGPTVTLQTTGGFIPSGTRYYYRYTVIDDAGNESAPSPIQPIDTPLAVAAPNAPALSTITGSGSLQPGTYSYVCSAYKGTNALETKASKSAAATIGGTSSSNSVSMILPDLPLGADGLNVYRKTPSGLHYLYLTSIPSPGSGDTWLDDGSITGDCDRSLPASNRTSNTNAVLVCYPGATPSIPAGWSWRIYRTTAPTNWAHSYLTELTPIGATPYTPVCYLDVGGATQVGQPPTRSQVINAPPKIVLTDAAEIQGVLPPGKAVVPHTVTFTWPGPLTATLGSHMWVCDFDEADIIHCRAYLGVDSVPAATDVIVDVNAYRPSAGSTTWVSAYSDGPDRPRVLVGENVGASTVPGIRHLERGDALSVDIDQAGGGATPTDVNLTVAILLYTKDGSETDSYGWAS